MKDIVQDLVKTLGIRRLLGVAAVLLGVAMALLAAIWSGAHWTAQPGESVSVLWGLVEYTKDLPVVVEREAKGSSWAGTWHHRMLGANQVVLEGTLTLEASGLSISGKYEGDSEGRVAGRISSDGNQFVGLWDNRKGQVGGLLLEVAGPRRFRGTYSIGIAPPPPQPKNLWVGARDKAQLRTVDVDRATP